MNRKQVRGDVALLLALAALTIAGAQTKAHRRMTIYKAPVSGPVMIQLPTANGSAFGIA